MRSRKKAKKAAKKKTTPATPETPPEAPAEPAKGPLEDEAIKRAQEARDRNAATARARRKKQKDTDREREELEGEPQWFVPPTVETITEWVEKGIGVARTMLVRSLEKVHDPKNAEHVAELEKFREWAVLGNMEVWCTATGLAGLAQKYRLLINRLAPELLTLAGVCFFVSSQLKLRRQMNEMKAQWKKPKSPSSLDREEAGSQPYSGPSVVGIPAE